MKVLAADDEPSVLLQYQLILSEKGHQVTCADNGLACLEAYRKALSTQSSQPPFDLVLLDYRMPQLDGLAVAKEILNICPGQRIIFASAYVIETLRDLARDLGQIV